jgi:hypothetical protein
MSNALVTFFFGKGYVLDVDMKTSDHAQDLLESLGAVFCTGDGCDTNACGHPALLGWNLTNPNVMLRSPPPVPIWYNAYVEEDRQQRPRGIQDGLYRAQLEVFVPEREGNPYVVVSDFKAATVEDWMKFIAEAS